jgi:hypothetical protein
MESGGPLRPFGLRSGFHCPQSLPLTEIARPCESGRVKSNVCANMLNLRMSGRNLFEVARSLTVSQGSSQARNPGLEDGIPSGYRVGPAEFLEFRAGQTPGPLLRRFSNLRSVTFRPGPVGHSPRLRKAQ